MPGSVRIPPARSPYAGQAIRILGRDWRLILRTALKPFVLAVVIMSIGCPLGIPARLPFDALHILIQVSYMTAMARIAMGTVPGRRAMGFALPRPAWPGLTQAALIFGEALLLLVPGVLLFGVFTFAIRDQIAALDAIVVTVISRIGPMFVLSTLLGLVIGAGMAKIGANLESRTHAHRREGLQSDPP